ncbi:MAG: TIGR03905 family TSCPD domain-containing protein [Clostridia bacterium]|nr:TIGR03905 family TSCPD domain-containing protein [Clostridia bacterium]NLS84865.1 TIGR03905 family TSCPD domain-containing protein [Oscillospiraceae bacterium]
MTHTRRNRGVCSLSTAVELAPDHTIENVSVTGGCNGNLNGICSLLQGMKAEDAIARLKGMTCGMKSTSCPDQVALTLEEAIAAIR